MSNKISFFQSKKITCPVCEAKFAREIMRTGGGRIIAAELMDDLRRQYRKSTKYGVVNPLIYNPVVCPSCLYAALPEDFARVPQASTEALNNEANARKRHSEMIFGEFDYNQNRTLQGGAKAFFLCLCSYGHFPKNFAPSTKKAICSMRASWCVSDLHLKNPKENYDTLYHQIRYLAFKSYEKSFETTSTGSEDFRSVDHVGPDTDVNFGYEGVLYMTCYLRYEHRDLMTERELYERFSKDRTILAKVFGFGKASKSKPSPLLLKAKNLHERLHAELEVLKPKYEPKKAPKP